MNESQSYKNWALEELINYVNSVAVHANESYDDSLSKIMPVNRNESYKNWALEELINYVNSVAVHTNGSYNDLINQITPIQGNLVDVEVKEISRETPQKTNCSLPSQLQIGENEEVALSPSNLGNLIVLIQNLRLSNGDLVKQVNYLSQAIIEFHQDLETYKVQFHAASSRLGEQNQELETSYQTIQEQQRLIEKLTTELASNKELLAQVQADHEEQSYQLSAGIDNCRDLRTRLNREQQHSLQLKVALEKCLEVPTASYQSAKNDAVSDANNLEDSASFASKAPPIKPWTTQTRCGGNKIDSSWERQSSAVEETEDFQPIDLENAIASPEHLEPSNSLTEEDLEEATVVTDTYEVQVELPTQTNHVNVQAKSPSPLVYPSRPPKGRKSLAAIELPSFIS